MCQIMRSLSAAGVFAGYFRRRTRRNKAPSDKAAATVQASIATFTKGGMGTVRILFPLPTRSMNTQRPSRCWMCPHSRAASSLRRKAQPKSTARIARSLFPSMVSRLGLSEQVARLFPGKSVPRPAPGLTDAVRRLNSLGHVAVQQPVLRSVDGEFADGGEPDVHRGRRQASCFEETAVLLHDASAQSPPRFGGNTALSRPRLVVGVEADPGLAPARGVQSLNFLNYSN